MVRLSVLDVGVFVFFILISCKCVQYSWSSISDLIRLLSGRVPECEFVSLVRI